MKIWFALSIMALGACVGFAQGVGAQAHGEGLPVNQSPGPPVSGFSYADAFASSNLTVHCIARSHGPVTVIPVTSVTNASPGVFTTAANGFQGGELVTVAGVSNVPAGQYQVVYISGTSFSLADPVTGVAVNTSASSTGGTVTTDAPLLNQKVWAIQINTYSGSNKVRSSYVNGDTSMVHACSISPPLLSSHFVQALGPSGGTTTAFNGIGAKLIVVNTSTFSGGWCGGSGHTISDSQSNVYISAGSYLSGLGDGIEMFYVFNPTVTGSMTITCSGANVTVSVLPFSGTFVGTTEGLNGATTTSGTTLATGSTSTLTAPDHEVCVTGVNFSATSGTVSIDTGFTITDQVPTNNAYSQGDAGAYLVPPSTSALNPTWTFPSGRGAAEVLCFK